MRLIHELCGIFNDNYTRLHVRKFLAAHMIVYHPSSVFTSGQELEKKVLDVSRVLLKHFHEISLSQR